MRFLVAMMYAKELKAGVYTPTKKTSYFVTGSMMIDALLHLCVMINRSGRRVGYLSMNIKTQANGGIYTIALSPPLCSRCSPTTA